MGGPGVVKLRENEQLLLQPAYQRAEGCCCVCVPGAGAEGGGIGMGVAPRLCPWSICSDQLGNRVWTEGQRGCGRGQRLFGLDGISVCECVGALRLLLLPHSFASSIGVCSVLIYRAVVSAGPQCSESALHQR